MGPHPHRFGRMLQYSTCWIASPRLPELLLVCCLCLHAFFCSVSVSALASQNESTSLDCGKSSMNGITPDGLSSGTRSCHQDMKNSVSTQVPAQKSTNQGVLIGTVVSAVIALTVIATIFICCYYRTRQRKPADIEKLDPREETMLSFADAKAYVKRATRNFGRKIGEGGFGPVYFGKLPGSNQMEVAVKVQAKGSHQGAREFATEVEILSLAKHPNLVSLVGYSEEEGGYMLVYEFLGGGTLQERLYGNRSNPPLAWKTRLKIAVQSATGLEYLHNECVPSIIHRDVKSNNILLTKLDDAKVTDFGLSKFLGANAYHISKCSVKGTSGYLDPEYFESQKLTHKSDVYSFGIVLLELVSGREPLDTNRHRDAWKISDWARNHLIAGEIEKVADKALEGKYNTQSMWTVAELAMTCVEPKAVHRPKISEVVKELEAAVKEEAKDTSGP